MPHLTHHCIFFSEFKNTFSYFFKRTLSSYPRLDLVTIALFPNQIAIKQRSFPSFPTDIKIPPPLPTPYFDFKTKHYKASWLASNPHLHLLSNTSLNPLMFFIPNSHLSFGRHTSSHLTHEIFPLSSSPSPKKASLDSYHLS